MPQDFPLKEGKEERKRKWVFTNAVIIRGFFWEFIESFRPLQDRKNQVCLRTEIQNTFSLFNQQNSRSKFSFLQIFGNKLGALKLINICTNSSCPPSFPLGLPCPTGQARVPGQGNVAQCWRRVASFLEQLEQGVLCPASLCLVFWALSVA